MLNKRVCHPEQLTATMEYLHCSRWKTSVQYRIKAHTAAKLTKTMDANKKKETIIQTFHPSFSELYISQTIDVSRFLFQFESGKKIFTQ